MSLLLRYMYSRSHQVITLIHLEVRNCRVLDSLVVPRL